MKTLAAQDVAIGVAIKKGTLRYRERPSRFGGTFIAIEDDHGVIEVADTMKEAFDLTSQVAGRLM